MIKYWLKTGFDPFFIPFLRWKRKRKRIASF
jgi:hypothetical protein